MYPNTDIYVVEAPKNGLHDELHRFEDSNKRTSFDDCLQIIGFGKVQAFVTLCGGLVLMAVINETMGMSIIMPAAHCDLKLDSTRKGILSAASFLGILISSQIWGYLADTRGRRAVIVRTLLISNACTVVSSFANNFWLFAVLRFITGFFVSGCAATVYAFVGEFNTVRNQATAVAWASLFVALSHLFLPAFGWLFLPQTWSLYLFGELYYRPWRLLVIIYTIPGFIGALLMLKLPESPKFVLAQGDEAKCLDILGWIYRVNTGKSKEEFPVKLITSEMDEDHHAKIQESKGSCSSVNLLWVQTVPLFQTPHVLYVLICCTVMFGEFFVSAGLGIWFPDIQNNLAQNDRNHIGRTVCETLEEAFIRKRNVTSSDLSICDDTVNVKVFADALTLGGFYLLGYIAYATIIKPLGRGVIMAVALFASGLAGLALQWVNEPIAIVVLFCIHLMLSGICVSVTNGAVVQLIPTHLRAMAVCIVLMFGRLGTIVGSNVVGLLLEVNCSATFLLTALFIIGCGALTIILPCH